MSQIIFHQGDWRLQIVNSIHSLKLNVLFFILIILVENVPSHDSTEVFSLKLRLFILCSYAAQLF